MKVDVQALTAAHKQAPLGYTQVTSLLERLTAAQTELEQVKGERDAVIGESALSSGILELCQRNAALLAENRAMRGLLEQVIDGDDVIVEAAVFLHSDNVPLTTAETARVAMLESDLAAAQGVIEGLRKALKITGTKRGDGLLHWCYCEEDADGNDITVCDCKIARAALSAPVRLPPGAMPTGQPACLEYPGAVCADLRIAREAVAEAIAWLRRVQEYYADEQGGDILAETVSFGGMKQLEAALSAPVAEEA